jgi:hypothetical protein
MVILAVSMLWETPPHTTPVGRDGAPCRVWANPTRSGFAEAIKCASHAELAGLRAVTTSVDIHVWQSVNLLHTDFERATGIQGVRLALRSGGVLVNDETIAMPEHFPWVFPDITRAMILDTEDRRTMAVAWIQANVRLRPIYPTGFTAGWYS